MLDTSRRTCLGTSSRLILLPEALFLDADIAHHPCQSSVLLSYSCRPTCIGYRLFHNIPLPLLDLVWHRRSLGPSHTSLPLRLSYKTPPVLAPSSPRFHGKKLPSNRRHGVDQ